MSGALTTGIVDLHHHDGAYDLAAFKRGGGVAVVHKATEGKDWRDPRFAEAMGACKVAGLHRGAYHFGSASAPGAAQADFFLSVVEPHPNTLLGLDLERNPGRSGTMATSEAASFARRVREVTGRWPVLYAGASDLRGRVAKAPVDVREVLARCPLWVAAYGPDPRTLKVPPLWPAFALHQYTNGAEGPADRATFPHRTPGFVDEGQDRSVFFGDDLAAWWKTAGLG